MGFNGAVSTGKAPFMYGNAFVASPYFHCVIVIADRTFPVDKLIRYAIEMLVLTNGYMIGAVNSKGLLVSEAIRFGR